MSSTARKRSKEDVPMWRRRIARAVSPHGQLKAIADAAHMKSPQLQRIANGATENPGIVTLARIAEAMKLTLGELIAEKEEDEPHEGLKSAPKQPPPSHFSHSGSSGFLIPTVPSSTIGHGENLPVPDSQLAVSAFKEATIALEEAADILRDITAGTLVPKLTQKASAPRRKSAKRRR